MNQRSQAFFAGFLHIPNECLWRHAGASGGYPYCSRCDQRMRFVRKATRSHETHATGAQLGVDAARVFAELGHYVPGEAFHVRDGHAVRHGAELVEDDEVADAVLVDELL